MKKNLAKAEQALNEQRHLQLMLAAQSILIQRYGLPSNDYLTKFCTHWAVRAEFHWFPTDSFLVNIDFRDKLRVAFKLLESYGLEGQIQTYDGCYNDRDVRGSSVKSIHAWAAAIDFNADTEPLGQVTTHFSKDFLSCFAQAGIYWGGNWIHRKDPMHFALVNG